MTHCTVTSNTRVGHSWPIHVCRANYDEIYRRRKFSLKCFSAQKKCLDLDSAKVGPTSALYNASCISKRLPRTCNLVRIFWRIINANQIHFFRIFFLRHKSFLIFPKFCFNYVHTDKILCVFSSNGTPRAICHWRSVWRRWVIFWGAHFILFVFQNSRNFVESCLLLFLFFFFFGLQKCKRNWL